MSEPRVTPEYVQAALEAQGLKREASALAGPTTAVGLMLKSAARGFAALEFEAEPAGFALDAAQRPEARGHRRALLRAARRVDPQEGSQLRRGDGSGARARQAVQPKLNCFIRIDADRRSPPRAPPTRRSRAARRAVRCTACRWRQGMYYRSGAVSTCGARLLREHPAGTTASVLERLDAAGAIQFGVLNMAEFAFNPTGHNWHYGHCRNPWDPQRVTGGSSSGSGSSVAARAAFAALGSDTGGSIRLPAHFCGISGIKPTYARVSRAGAMPLSFSMDTVGPLTRTVQDAALILQVIAGPDPRDPTCENRPLPD